MPGIGWERHFLFERLFLGDVRIGIWLLDIPWLLSEGAQVFGDDSSGFLILSGPVFRNNVLGVVPDLLPYVEGL